MTIPASDLVTVNPGVVSSGGSPLSLNGLILSQSLYLPTAAVQSFTSTTAVKDYFGASSTEFKAFEHRNRSVHLSLGENERLKIVFEGDISYDGGEPFALEHLGLKIVDFLLVFRINFVISL